MNNEKYYQIKLTYNNIVKCYIVSALHELQARERLIKDLKLKNEKIKNIIIEKII